MVTKNPSSTTVTSHISPPPPHVGGDPQHVSEKFPIGYCCIVTE